MLQTSERWNIHVFSARCLRLTRLRTPRRASARIALHARAVPHQREIPALPAGFAFVAFGAGFGALFGGGRFGVGAGVGPGQMLERLRRRELWLRLALQ